MVRCFVCIVGLLGTACASSMGDRTPCVGPRCGAPNDAGRVDATVHNGSDADAGPHCRADTDCPDGFCDRTGACAAIDTALRHGTACKRAPELPTGNVEPLLNTCGAYLCTDARCRSCLTDEECNLEYMAPQCRSVATGPGNRCGNYGP